MRLYTRGGDKGQTSAIGGRLSKDDVRIEAYGTLDELNAFVGNAVSQMELVSGNELFNDMQQMLLQIQHELFDCGSDLAFLAKGDRRYKVTPHMTAQLEAWIDLYHEEAPALAKFILPGGSSVSSSFHICRTVCRRAERSVVKFFHARTATDDNDEVLKYLNRLSDLFFVLARAANARLGISDVEYERSAHVFQNEEPQEQ